MTCNVDPRVFVRLLKNALLSQIQSLRQKTSIIKTYNRLSYIHEFICHKNSILILFKMSSSVFVQDVSAIYNINY